MNKFDETFENLINEHILDEGIKNTLIGVGAAATIASSPISKATEVQPQKNEQTKKLDSSEMNKHKDIFSKPISDEAFKKLTFEMLKKDEGIVLHLYDDARGSKHKWKPGDNKKGKITIGIGHLVKPNEIQKFVNGIDEDIAFKIFDEDYVRELRKARKLFTNFDNYPTYLKLRLLNGTFRGEFEKEHDTVKLINKNQFIKAAGEYLRGSNNNKFRKDFQASRDSEESGKPHGVWKRMLKTRAAMIRYGNALRKWEKFLQNRKNKNEIQ